jgi:hypothetical protein
MIIRNINAFVNINGTIFQAIDSIAQSFQCLETERISFKIPKRSVQVDYFRQFSGLSGSGIYYLFFNVLFQTSLNSLSAKLKADLQRS